MSFGFSIGDFLTIPLFTWQVYKACRDSTSEYCELASEVQSLHAVMMTSQELLEIVTLSADQTRRLAIIGKGCLTLLQHIDARLSKYKSLGSKEVKLRHRLRWGMDKVANIRMRIISHTVMLAAFNSSITKSVLYTFFNSQVDKELDAWADMNYKYLASSSGSEIMRSTWQDPRLPTRFRKFHSYSRHRAIMLGLQIEKDQSKIPRNTTGKST